MFETYPTHVMELIEVHPTGAETYLCPVPSCGRKFDMTWPPKYKKIVLNQGDLGVFHTGGKGGVRMGTPSITPQIDSVGVLPGTRSVSGSGEGEVDENMSCPPSFESKDLVGYIPAERRAELRVLEIIDDFSNRGE